MICSAVKFIESRTCKWLESFLHTSMLKGMDDETDRNSYYVASTCMRRKASQSGRWKLISPPKIPDDPQSHATSKSTDRPTDHIDEAEEGVSDEAEEQRASV